MGFVLWALFIGTDSTGQTITKDTLVNDSKLLILRVDSGSLHSQWVWKEVTYRGPN